MTNRLFRIFSILIIVTVFMSACGTTAAPERPPLRIGWITWGGFYPLVIGHEKGFFEQHGVNVEPIHFEIYNQSFPALDSGTLDGTTMSLGDAALLEGFSPGSMRFILIADVSMEAEAIVAAPDIATPQDLRGKSIGCNIGSYGELFVRRFLTLNNINPGEVTLVNIPPESVPAALARGEIQAGHTWEPSLTEAIKGGNRILLRASDQPGLITDGVAFRSAIAKERPEDLRAFEAAWFETITWWQSNPEEAAQIVAKNTGLSPDEVSTEGMRLLGLDENLAAFQPGKDTTSIYYTAGLYRDFLAETGVVSALLDVETMLDPSFLH
jgi:NitT/TauT family transport system substrate-binding protein